MSFKNEKWLNLVDQKLLDIYDYSEEHLFRDEICLAIIECLLIEKHQINMTKNDELDDIWIKMTLDVADICFKLLDAKDMHSYKNNSVWLAYLHFIEKLVRDIAKFYDLNWLWIL